MAYFTQLDSLAALVAQAAPAVDGNQGSPFNLLPGLALIAVLFYFLMIRPERKKAAAHKALLEQLKKNDRVVTIGGIYGMVMSVQREADEVTIKIDEATNTKIRVTFNAIARVLTDEPAGEKPA